MDIRELRERRAQIDRETAKVEAIIEERKKREKELRERCKLLGIDPDNLATEIETRTIHIEELQQEYSTLLEKAQTALEAFDVKI